MQKRQKSMAGKSPGLVLLGQSIMLMYKPPAKNGPRSCNLDHKPPQARYLGGCVGISGR
jgi:hypothetical protein